MIRIIALALFGACVGCNGDRDSEACGPFDGLYELTITPRGDDPCGSEPVSRVVRIAPGDLNVPPPDCSGMRSFEGCRLEGDIECPVFNDRGELSGYTVSVIAVDQVDGPARATGTGSIRVLRADRTVECQSGVLTFTYERL